MAIVQVLLGIAYPILIFVSLAWLEPRQVALVVLCLAALRFVVARPGFALTVTREVWIPVAVVGLVVVSTAIWNDAIGLLMTPTLINASLLATFGGSLWSDRPMVERFARMHVEDLSEAEVRYCRTVTKIWCVFFVVNGGIALGLALTREIEAWTLFTGFISYLLIGLLFASEYVYRHWRFRRYTGGVLDPILMRVFPPRPAPSAPADGTGNERIGADPDEKES